MVWLNQLDVKEMINTMVLIADPHSTHAMVPGPSPLCGPAPYYAVGARPASHAWDSLYHQTKGHKSFDFLNLSLAGLSKKTFF
jgi:hypothetical protein